LSGVWNDVSDGAYDGTYVLSDVWTYALSDVSDGVCV
jgi:hypothetical protein